VCCTTNKLLPYSSILRVYFLHQFKALNQLFEKIMALDIDERHLLRLGHGEEALETEKDFSRYGHSHTEREWWLCVCCGGGRWEVPLVLFNHWAFMKLLSNFSQIRSCQFCFGEKIGTAFRSAKTAGEKIYKT
jgi:hypothetical protein